MIAFARYHLALLSTALAFLSWLPIPAWGFTKTDLHKMGMYFPLAGALLGGIASLTLLAANLFFPYPVAIALVLLVYTLITGAFHDDALADVADGMGGYEPRKIIEIMRDSRIGAYGAMALISTYLLRYSAMVSIEPAEVALNLIAFAAAARLAGVLLLTVTRTNQIPPESLNRMVSFSGQWTWFLVGLLWLAIIGTITKPASLPWIIPVMTVLPMICHRYFNGRIGFITGDCAGFVIHLVETTLHVIATLS